MVGRVDSLLQQQPACRVESSESKASRTWIQGEAVWGLGFRVWSRHKVRVGAGTHPGRSHRCVAVNPPHDHPEFKQLRVLNSDAIQAGAQAALTRAAIQSGHDVMYFKAPAVSEAVLLNRLTSKAKARTGALLGYFPGCVVQPLSMITGECWLSARLFCWTGYHPSHVRDRQQSRRNVGLLPRPHGTAALSIVTVSVRLLCRGTSVAA